MTRYHLIAGLLLGLGVAGVATVASQAARRLSSEDSGGAARADVSRRSASLRATRAVRSRDGVKPGVHGPAARRMATARRVRPAAARAPGQGEGAARAPGQGEGARSASGPRRAARAGAGRPAERPGLSEPPRPAGPPPALVIQFSRGASHPSRAARQAVRRLVRANGYKGVYYELLPYAAERRELRRNHALGRKRCRRVRALIRKAGGVSRRWIRCLDPVVPPEASGAQTQRLSPAWRRVEIRIKR